MKFVLHQINIWFKEDIEPRVLEFVGNKVNVITGDSGSGKTNILAIIDYCLLSSKVNIVEQVINENAEWYSIEFSVNSKKYFIARRKLNLGQENSDICFIDAEDKIPNYPFANILTNKAKGILDEIFGISNKYPFSKDKGVYPFENSYRTNLVFSYLTERIITLDNTFFDFDYFEKSLFGNFKEYVVNKVLGFDDTKLKEYEKQLAEIKKSKEDFDKKQRNILNKTKNIDSEIDKLINKSIENGLLDSFIYFDIESKIDTLISVTNSYFSVAESERNNSTINALKEEKRRLEIESRNIQKAEKAFLDYERNINSYKDVLKPIEILNNQNEDVVRSFETKQLIDALNVSLREIKNSNIRAVGQKLTSPLEKERLKNRIQDIKKEIDRLNPSGSNIKNRTNYAFVIATEIKRDLDGVLKNRPKDNGDLDFYITDYPTKCLELESKINKEKKVKPTLINTVNNSIQLFYNQLNSMENYAGCETNFDMTEFIVQLKEPRSGYPYGNIGSKSNYMFLHLCLFLGLHNHFRSINNEHTMPFLFIDQPSIPYYSGTEKDNGDDKSKLVDAFKLLNNFISFINEKYNTEFQILLIEHAPESYWKEAKLDNFHTVEIFTHGNKLIPNRILHKQ